MSRQVEVVQEGKLVVVHDVSVNYDQPVAEAISGLPDNGSLVSSIPQAIWSGGKTGTAETDIHLARPGKILSTEKGRQLLRGQSLNPCVPAELSALRPFCQRLWELGVYWAVALGPSDDALWQYPLGSLGVVYLCFYPDDLGFRVAFAGPVWGGHYSFAGLPQVS